MNKVLPPPWGRAGEGVELVIFDCDGVLVDSEPIANRVLSRQLATLGIALSADDVMRRFLGRTREGCITLVEEMLGGPAPRDFATRWDAELFATLRREVRAVEGVAELLRAMRLPYCVASNGTSARVRMTLEAAGLVAYFEGRMFTAEDVANPKPAPDLFLHAAKVMGAPPSRTAVIEDTVTGVQAAVAAGMKAFAYVGATYSDPEVLRGAGADIITSMHDAAAHLGLQ